MIKFSDVIALITRYKTDKLIHNLFTLILILDLYTSKISLIKSKLVTGRPRPIPATFKLQKTFYHFTEVGGRLAKLKANTDYTHRYVDHQLIM